MKHIIFILVCMAGWQHCLAQNTISGKVFDAKTNQPLSGASISISPNGNTRSDESGTFSIPCGSRWITVSYQGFITAQHTIRNCEEAITIRLQLSNSELAAVEITTVAPVRKELIYQPASIAKISLTEIRRGTGLFLDDAINSNVPGVFMQRRSVSAGQNFNIRGYGNGARGTNGVSSNFDNQGSKVYLNGIPVTDAEGITMMDDIDFGSIGSAEVIKGPSGTLYGLAIAGVVNLQSIRPAPGKTSIGQEVLVGSAGLRRYTTTFQMGRDNSSLLLNYGHQESDGFMIHTASRKNFVNAAGSFTISNRQTLHTYFGYSSSYEERAGELTIGQYDTLDYSGNPRYIKNNAHSAITGFRAGATHIFQFNNSIGNTTTIFGSASNINNSSAGGWTDKDPVNFGLRSTIDTRLAFGNVSLSGITGIETQQQRAQTIGYTMVPDSNDLAGYNRIGAMRNNQNSVSTTTSLFTEWNLSLPKDFSIVAGIGMSQMDIELNDRFYVASANREPSRFKKTYRHLFSPHLALNKVFSKAVSVYASYSTGYKAPVSAYFYIPFVTGAPGTGLVNGNLKPEKGLQFEIGTKGVLMKKLVYEISAFRTIFEDKMTAVAVPLDANTTAYSYLVNGGRLNNKGIEALVRYRVYESAKGFLRTITPFSNVAWSHFRYENFKFQTLNATKTEVIDNDYSGQPVAGVPPLTFNAGFDLTTHVGLYLNAYYNYRDAMTFTSDGLNKTNSYSLVNGKIGFRRSMSSHLDLDAWAGVQNLTGTQYYIMVFVNQLPDAYIPAPRNAVVFGGVNLKYNF